MKKQDYEKRELNAEKRMEKNAQAESLTEEQHDVLANLCRIRHEVHTHGTEVLYNDEHSQNVEFWEYVDTFNNDPKISEMLTAVGLPELEWKCNGIDFDTSTFCETDEERDAAIWALSDLISAWNEAIERYLRAIDEAHGTNYAPTGAYRI